MELINVLYIYESGKVSWVKESANHTLFALDKDGDRTGASLTLNDRSVFDQLTKTGANSDYSASFAFGNPSNLASAFLFAADNSNVEWRFARFNQGNGDEYVLNTIHNTSSVNSENLGYRASDEIAFIHSHPNSRYYTNATGEYGSMGWKQYTDPYTNKLNISIRGDSWNVATGNPNSHPSNANYLTYFPHSGNIYQVRGVQQPAFIRNISNHNNNPNKLFWGVLNGK